MPARTTAPSATTPPEADPTPAFDGHLLRIIAGGDRAADARTSAAHRRANRYRQFLDALGVAVYTTDADGMITFFNAAAATFWGRRPAIGEVWCGSLRLLWPDGAPMRHDECPMAVTLREARAVRGGQAIAIRPDDTQVSFTAYPTPLFDDAGHADRRRQRARRHDRARSGRTGAPRIRRGARGLECGQGSVPGPRLARAAHAGDHDLRQRPAAPGAGRRPDRRGPRRDDRRHRDRREPAPRDHREPAPAHPPRVGHARGPGAGAPRPDHRTRAGIVPGTQPGPGHRAGRRPPGPRQPGDRRGRRDAARAAAREPPRQRRQVQLAGGRDRGRDRRSG